MRIILCLFSLFFTKSIYSQDSTEQIATDHYNIIMNHTPVHLKNNKKNRPNNHFLKAENLNTIISLQLSYQYKDSFKFNETETLWLESRIDQLAVALFLDGKKVLLEKVGGYSGCPKKLIIKNKEITILRLCHSCTDGHHLYKFVDIFNRRMNKLLNSK